MTNATTSAVFERELRHLLIRHLPVGLEGIGVAQANAVLNLVQRREQHRARPIVSPTQREGMRLLKKAAEAHASAATIGLDGETVCTVCRGEDGEVAVWPCPVFSAAELMGVIDDPTTAEVV